MGCKKIIVLFLVLTVFGCKVLKDKNHTKENHKQTETVEQKTFRRGDTVAFFVPKIKLKDTTIYTYNRVGTKVITRFDNSGKIDSIACISSSIAEFTKINRELVKSINEKTKNKETKTSNTLVVGLLVILGLIVAYVIFRVESFFKLKRNV